MTKLCRNCGEPFIPEAWQRRVSNCPNCLYRDREGRIYAPLLRQLRQGLRRIEAENKWAREWRAGEVDQEELQRLAKGWK